MYNDIAYFMQLLSLFLREIAYHITVNMPELAKRLVFSSFN